MINKQQAMQILQLSGTCDAETIKKAYRKLAMQYHPDKNPAGGEMMKLINAAWDALKNEEEVTCNETELNSYPEELSEAINAIISLSGIDIEVCGLWVWVSGNTKDHKDILKTAGYFWASQKKMWYFRPSDMKKRRGGKTWSIDDIRSMHGTNKVQPKQFKQLAA